MLQKWNSVVFLFSLYLCFLCLVSIKAEESGKNEDLKLSSETSFDTSGNTAEEGRKRDPKYAFNFVPTLPILPADSSFSFDLSNITANGSTGNPQLDPILTSIILAKGGIFSILSAIKTILPHVIIVGLVILFAIAAASLLICTFTDCNNLGASPGRPNFLEEGPFKRNSFEYEQPVYQALDEDYMKHKYNQINPGKTY